MPALAASRTFAAFDLNWKCIWMSCVHTLCFLCTRTQHYGVFFSMDSAPLPSGNQWDFTTESYWTVTVPPPCFWMFYPTQAPGTCPYPFFQIGETRAFVEG